jgi:hypothetical protein
VLAKARWPVQSVIDGDFLQRMTELRCSNSRDPCFNCRISYDFGGDYEMFRTVLIAKPEVLGSRQSSDFKARLGRHTPIE